MSEAEESWKEHARYFRNHWCALLRNYTPSPLDYTNYAASLEAAPATVSYYDSAKDDFSVSGLGATAPLLELGYKEGASGKLIPVAAVTARDLLNYGWELNSLQMGSGILCRADLGCSRCRPVDLPSSHPYY